MNLCNNFPSFSRAVNLLVIATLLSVLLIRAECLNFSFPSFPDGTKKDLIISSKANIAFDAIQVTEEAGQAPPDQPDIIANLSGRVLYKQPLKLWSKKNGIASFNSTFVLNIFPKSDPGGEGLAFILTEDGENVPENSHGEWLGIGNASTNGSDQSRIFAVEFDTKKSYPEDIDNNHVGVDINSVYSIKQVSLKNHSVNVSSGENITAGIQYDGKSKILDVFVFMTNETETGGSRSIPVLSMLLNLSQTLPEDVFVGFSASTGKSTQLNCVKSWNFTSTAIDDGGVDLLWVWISIPVVLAALTICLCYWKLKCREQRVRQVEDPKVEKQIMSLATAPQKFRLKELKRATSNFNPKNKLGRGGCGTVYKGLVNNKELAVKRISKDSSRGNQDFVAEVTTIGNLRHKNLVKLVGWCCESNELLLVYELMPNGSLDKFIFEDETADLEDRMLSWEMRYRIICGVATVLDYLHNGCEKRVLHRDIKASNIMLDLEFNPRLGDFGLARTILESEMTHHSTKEIAGTPGYMAPETFLTGRATAETDIYGFGMLLLEVACGRKPGNQSEPTNYNNGIVGWVWELHRSERIIEAMDIRLGENFEWEKAETVLKLGLACCHPNPYQRPSMRTALQVLKGEAPPPPIPSEKPAFVWPAIAGEEEELFEESVFVREEDFEEQGEWQELADPNNAI